MKSSHKHHCYVVVDTGHSVQIRQDIEASEGEATPKDRQVDGQTDTYRHIQTHTDTTQITIVRNRLKTLKALSIFCARVRAGDIVVFAC